jgi:hypothetical protein
METIIGFLEQAALPLAAVAIIGLILMQLWQRQQARRTISFVVTNGRIMDDLPGNPTMSLGTPAGTFPTGLQVIVHLAGGVFRPRHYEQVIPLRFWLENAEHGWLDFGRAATLSGGEQQLIREELIRRNNEAWEHSAEQVRRMLAGGEAA